MASFIIAKNFASNDAYIDFSVVIESVGVPEEWLLQLRCMKNLDQYKMKPLITQQLWGDGTGTIPHFSLEDIIQIKGNCHYILSYNITPQDILDESLSDEYIELLKEFRCSLEKLITMCDRALTEGLVMVFLSN